MIYLGNGMYSDSGPNSQLMHYGVLGMRWGHRTGILDDIRLARHRRRYKKREEWMKKKRPDLVNAKDSTSNALNEYTRKMVDKYHKNKKFRAAVNKSMGNKPDFHAKPQFDDDMTDFDHVEHHLSKTDNNYNKLSSEWAHAYRDYSSEFYKKRGLR